MKAHRIAAIYPTITLLLAILGRQVATCSRTGCACATCFRASWRRSDLLPSDRCSFAPRRL